MKNNAETKKTPKAKATKTEAAPKAAKAQKKAKEPTDRLPSTVDELKAGKAGLATYLFLSGQGQGRDRGRVEVGVQALGHTGGEGHPPDRRPGAVLPAGAVARDRQVAPRLPVNAPRAALEGLFRVDPGARTAARQAANRCENCRKGWFRANILPRLG